MTPIIDSVDPLAVAATDAIRSGDGARLRQLLADHLQSAAAAVGTLNGHERPSVVTLMVR